MHRGSSMEEKGAFVLEGLKQLGPKEWEFTFDRECDDGCEGDLLENMTCQPEVPITNCHFGKATTHLRFQTRSGVMIEHCITELPFWLTGDTNYWYEGSPVAQMKVRDVRFETGFATLASIPEFTPTAKMPYYHGEIEIEYCIFETDTPISARQTASICFHKNENSLGKPMQMVIQDCGKVEADGVQIIERRKE